MPNKYTCTGVANMVHLIQSKLTFFLQLQLRTFEISWMDNLLGGTAVFAGTQEKGSDLLEASKVFRRPGGLVLGILKALAILASRRLLLLENTRCLCSELTHRTHTTKSPNPPPLHSVSPRTCSLLSLSLPQVSQNCFSSPHG